MRSQGGSNKVCDNQEKAVHESARGTKQQSQWQSSIVSYRAANMPVGNLYHPHVVNCVHWLGK